MHHAVLDGIIGSPAVKMVPCGRHDTLQVVGMHMAGPCTDLVRDFRLLEPQQGLQNRIKIDLARLDLPIPHAHFPRVHGECVAFLTQVQCFLRLLTLSDVIEHHHGTDNGLPFTNGSTNVFHGERTPILAPQHPFTMLTHGSGGQRGHYGTGFPWMRSGVRFRMEQHGMHRLAEQLLDRIPCHGGDGWIHKGGVPLQVQSINAFSRRA